MHTLSNTTVVITRDAKGNVAWSSRLHEVGVNVYSLPTIETIPLELSAEDSLVLKSLSDFDWVVFTSAACVRYFLDALGHLEVAWQESGPGIAAIGEKTAGLLSEHGMEVVFMSSKATGVALGKELAPVDGKRILLPRTDIASEDLALQLRSRGGAVTTLPLYTTRLIDSPDEEFQRMLREGAVDYIVFASPSAFRGFSLRVADPELLLKALGLPVVAIGHSTAEALDAAGFTYVSVSATPSVEGVVSELQRLVSK